MNDFLKAKKHALLNSKDKLTIVVGNQSCDLDSMTSAVLYSWFRGHDPPAGAFSTTYIPLLNIPQEDIKLRPEFEVLFQDCNINQENLVTLSDLPSEDELSPDRTQWILVDHNKLEGKLGDTYSSRVSGCIDHHDEENSVPKDTDSEPRIIEKAGSCTTLVMREFAKKLFDGKAAANVVHSTDRIYSTDVLKLGLASILVDNRNLKETGPVREKDKHVAEKISSILWDHNPDSRRTDFYNLMNDAKKNLDGLSTQDVLRKDYKLWIESDIRIGTSSVVRDLEFLYNLSEKEHASHADYWRSTAHEFMQQRGLDIWAILTAYPKVSKDDKDSFARQLEIHWKDDRLSALVNRFEEKHKDELQLTATYQQQATAVEKQTWKTWQQGNVSATRKQIAPMLRNIAKQCA